MAWDRIHSVESTLGTAGLLRCTQPMRVLASAAELGLLPPGLPVRIRVRPALPSSRAALRRLARHHDHVVTI